MKNYRASIDPNAIVWVEFGSTIGWGIYLYTRENVATIADPKNGIWAKKPLPKNWIFV